MANSSWQFESQRTALVHEAWLHLVGHEQPDWAGSRHFFATATEATTTPLHYIDWGLQRAASHNYRIVQILP